MYESGDNFSTYGGAPDECGWHFRNGEILKLEENGKCPKQDEHPSFD